MLEGCQTGLANVGPAAQIRAARGEGCPTSLTPVLLCEIRFEAVRGKECEGTFVDAK